jgi:hypothetical protein
MVLWLSPANDDEKDRVIMKNEMIRVVREVVAYFQDAAQDWNH